MWLVGASVLVGMGCRQITLPDKKLACSTTRTCPSPYRCHKDNFCYRAGETDAAIDQAQDEALETSNDAAIKVEHDGAAEVQPMDAPGASDDTLVDSLGSPDVATDTGPIVVPKVNVTIQRSGNGSVTGTGGISCVDSSCVVSESSGTTLSLMAVAAAGSHFTGWTGDCTGTTNPCTLSSIIAAKNVTAMFVLDNANFTISKTGNGAGTVSATWAGGGPLSCGTTCSAQIAPGTVVTLTATPATGSSFTAWGGCTGTGTCGATVVAGGTDVGATFTLNQFLLSASLTGPAGTGSVLSATAGVSINCGGTCAALVNYGTAVQLVATPSGSGAFSSWSGCDSVTGGTTCNVTVMSTKSVTAAFKRSNGNPCGATTDCASNFCVAGTCCSTACPGVGVTNGCDTSCNGGTCQHAPARTACGSVHNFQAPDPTNTSFTDVKLMCDGSGTCAAPKISCVTPSGAVPCQTGGTLACCDVYSGMNTGEGFPIFKISCDAYSKCASTATIGGFNCGQTADCPSGLVCCQQDDDSQHLSWAICTSAASCAANNGAQICKPGGSDCTTGTCTPGSDYSYCQ
jgi:Divergent InlB B-repeat domain